jgi:hypothetical protein
MPDQFQEITKMSYPAKVLGSIFGILVGLLLFVASLVILFYNEGRFDISTLAKNAVVFNADQGIALQHDGKLVAATGLVVSPDVIGDNLFLKPGPYAVIDRIVEMYAWNEDKSEHEDTDGDKTTTYTYNKAWTRAPEDSERFHDAAGHINPKLPILSERVLAASAKIGAYGFDLGSVYLPSLVSLPLTADNTVLSQGAVLGRDGYIRIYRDKAASSTEQIGDVRISYQVFNSRTGGTLFGQASGNLIKPYFDAKNNKLFRLVYGSKEEGVAQMHTEFVVLTWALRILSFMLMWFGLSLIFGPISAVFGFIPFLGEVTGCVVSLLMFVVALVLQMAVIFIFLAIHSFWIIVVLIVAVLYLVFFGYRKMKAGAKSAPPAAPIK